MGKRFNPRDDGRTREPKGPPHDHGPIVSDIEAELAAQVEAKLWTMNEIDRLHQALERSGVKVGPELLERTSNPTIDVAIAELERLRAAERALWDIFLEAGADPSPYCHETRTPKGRRAGFEDWRKRTNAYGEVVDVVRMLREDTETRDAELERLRAEFQESLFWRHHWEAQAGYQSRAAKNWSVRAERAEAELARLRAVEEAARAAYDALLADLYNYENETGQRLIDRLRAALSSKEEK